MNREGFPREETGNFHAPTDDNEAIEVESTPEAFLESVGSYELKAGEAEANLLASHGDEEKDCNIQAKKLGSLNQSFRRRLRHYLPILLLALSEGHANRLPEGYFRDRTRAEDELMTKGITTEQQEAYKPGISELLYRTITPKGYQSLWRVIKQGPSNLLNRAERIIPPEDERDIEYRAQENPDREDAWRLYLGLPQRNNTFGISEYQPSKSQEDKYYYRINNWAERFAKSFKPETFDQVDDMTYTRNHLIPELLGILDDLDGIDRDNYEDYNSKHGVPWMPVIRNGEIVLGSAIVCDAPAGNDQFDDRRTIGIMGAFHLSKGEDEQGHYISYYDKWDLAESPTEGVHGGLGKSFEIYDRIYYDPETHMIIGPEKVDEGRK
ncbi:MAG: hypothetical protein V1838_02660 [Patescibacteria group bacterium]